MPSNYEYSAAITQNVNCYGSLDSYGKKCGFQPYNLSQPVSLVPDIFRHRQPHGMNTQDIVYKVPDPNSQYKTLSDMYHRR